MKAGDSMDYTVSAMSLADYEEAIRLWEKSEGVGLNESDTKLSIASFLERNPGLSLVARDQRNYLMAAILCGQDGRRGCLYHLAVAREYRLHGIGIDLVRRCLASLSALGITKCNIIVYADNEEGKKFWKRHGWQERLDMRIMHRLTSEDGR